MNPHISSNISIFLFVQIRDSKPQILQELETALQEQTPPSQNENSQLYELPPLVIDGIPTQVDKMTQVRQNLLPNRLKTYTRVQRLRYVDVKLVSFTNYFYYQPTDNGR